MLTFAVLTPLGDAVEPFSAPEGWQGAQTGTFLWQDKCPVAVLVGIDATPDPGLRGPTNFAGTLRETDILELDAALTEARRAGPLLPDLAQDLCPAGCPQSSNLRPCAA
jgi:hypothetical protein